MAFLAVDFSVCNRDLLYCDTGARVDGGAFEWREGGICSMRLLENASYNKEHVSAAIMPSLNCIGSPMKETR